jgi:hypothetical protein
MLLLSVKEILSQDLKLWYTKPASKWVEALPVGNGRIGAMIFGGIENDRIQFNEETYGQASQEAIAGREHTSIWILYDNYYLRQAKRSRSTGRERIYGFEKF